MQHRMDPSAITLQTHAGIRTSAAVNNISVCIVFSSRLVALKPIVSQLFTSKTIKFCQGDTFTNRNTQYQWNHIEMSSLPKSTGSFLPADDNKPLLTCLLTDCDGIVDDADLHKAIIVTWMSCWNCKTLCAFTLILYMKTYSKNQQIHPSQKKRLTKYLPLRRQNSFKHLLIFKGLFDRSACLHACLGQKDSCLHRKMVKSLILAVLTYARNFNCWLHRQLLAIILHWTIFTEQFRPPEDATCWNYQCRSVM